MKLFAHKLNDKVTLLSYFMIFSIFLHYDTQETFVIFQSKPNINEEKRFVHWIPNQTLIIPQFTILSGGACGGFCNDKMRFYVLCLGCWWKGRMTMCIYSINKIIQFNKIYYYFMNEWNTDLALWWSVYKKWVI